MEVHKRQFIVSRTQHRVSEHPRWLPLPDGFFLSYDADLEVEVRPDNRVVLGVPLAADLSAGRFVTIDWPYLTLDPTALLGVYFGRTDAGPLLTSSVALAAECCSVAVAARALRWAEMNWIPTPGSQLAGFAKLYRDQKLHIPTLSAEHVERPLRPLASYEAAVDTLSGRLVQIATEIGRRFGEVNLALTAGLDSRTLAAALVAADVPFKAVTQAIADRSKVDVEVARQVAARLGVQHEVIEPRGYDAEAVRQWAAHTMQSYDDADNHYLFPCSQYRFSTPGSALVRGGCFEIGRRFFAYRLRDITLANATGAEILGRFENEGSQNEAAIQDLEQWLAWRRHHSDGLDLADSFYLDQRVGGWLSAIEQAQDGLPGISVQPANCTEILCAMLTPPAQKQVSGALQRDAIKRLAPQLLEIPVNPKSAAERLVIWRRRAANVMGRVRALRSANSSPVR